MGLYKLNYQIKDLSDGFMEKANRESVDYEKDFENWLENSPHVLLEDESSTIMWIGRQVAASYGDIYKYPDLIGIDEQGNVVIVELKKGKTPRDVIAQILEYAAWADKLSYEELDSIAKKYYTDKEIYCDMNLKAIHQHIFYPDNEDEIDVKFNRGLRLYIVAEEISPVIKEVVSFLNQRGGIVINCLKYEVYKSSIGEYYIGTETENSVVKKIGGGEISVGSTNRWNGEKSIRSLVKETIDNLLYQKQKSTFSYKEVLEEILIKYPDMNKSSVRCQIYSDCVNHSSRKHYKSGQMNYYYQLEKTKYRLYNREIDGQWNSDGEKITE